MARSRIGSCFPERRHGLRSGGKVEVILAHEILETYGQIVRRRYSVAASACRHSPACRGGGRSRQWSDLAACAAPISWYWLCATWRIRFRFTPSFSRCPMKYSKARGSGLANPMSSSVMISEKGEPSAFAITRAEMRSPFVTTTRKRKCRFELGERRGGIRKCRPMTRRADKGRPVAGIDRNAISGRNAFPDLRQPWR